MKIFLNHTIQLQPLTVIGEKRIVKGVQREALSFIFDKFTSLDELNKVFNAENCVIITIEENNVHYDHMGYIVKGQIKYEPTLINQNTTDIIYEDRITVIMAQQTVEEKQIAALQAQINELTATTTKETII